METTEVLKVMAASAMSPSVLLPFFWRWTPAAAQVLTAEARMKGRPSSRHRWANPIPAAFVLRRDRLTGERGAHAEKPGLMAAGCLMDAIKSSNASGRTMWHEDKDNLRSHPSKKRFFGDFADGEDDDHLPGSKRRVAPVPV